jgi:hypothetical protein
MLAGSPARRRTDEPAHEVRSKHDVKLLTRHLGDQRTEDSLLALGRDEEGLVFDDMLKATRVPWTSGTKFVIITWMPPGAERSCRDRLALIGWQRFAIRNFQEGLKGIGWGLLERDAPRGKCQAAEQDWPGVGQVR